MRKRINARALNKHICWGICNDETLVWTVRLRKGNHLHNKAKCIYMFSWDKPFLNRGMNCLDLLIKL